MASCLSQQRAIRLDFDWCLMPSQIYIQYKNLMKSGAFRAAAELAEREAIGASTRGEFWLTQQANALLRCGEPQKALACAKRAVALAPRNGYALLSCANAEKDCGDTQSALADFRALYNDPRVGSRARDGALACLEAMGNWKELLAEAVSAGLEPEQVLRWRTPALAGMGHRDEAIEACREWVRLSPGSSRAHWKLVELEIERDGLEQVRLRMGRQAKIPNQAPIYGEIYASLCRKAGMERSAVGQYEKLAAGGGDVRFSRKQAFAMAKTDRVEEAIPILEEVLRTNPKDNYAHTSYIAACRRAGVLPRAEAFYTELIGRFPTIGGLYGRRNAVRKSIRS
ncbi:MAG: tetratricopeptide repeat protein [Chitinivibrionales bacterium]|nr:tetratricopeptide repeat protein [Chitinivibrionales bacterium]MBD3357822.1 tetratricopeptide repeat protein [Chitinivibrionales bacterium]